MLLQADGTTLLIVFVSILLSMSLHEATHAYVGHVLGDTTAYEQGRLTLNPLKHIDLFTTIILPIVLISLGLVPFFAAKPVPFNPLRVKYDEFGAAMIGVSGPLSNLLMATVTAFLIRGLSPATSSTLFYTLTIFMIVNIGLFVFNMIPFPPLDGSRLLYAFAPEPLQRLMGQIESRGFGAILIFMFVLFPILAPFMQAVTGNLLNFLLKLAGV